MLQHPPSQQQQGLVDVRVPASILDAGLGLSFALPAPIAATITAESRIETSAEGGGPLPGWLRFDRKTKHFTATTVPRGVLPVSVLLTIDGQRTVVNVAAQ